MQCQRVFVSGGAGVIGAEVIPRLVERGTTVWVGDLKPRPKNFPPEVIYRQGDLNYITPEEIQSFSPDIFIHLAATFERSTETYGFWEENYWNNVRLSHHLMTIMKDIVSLKRVVFASSYLIYDPGLYQFDEPQANPISLKEIDPVSPRNLTGMAKLAHEIELEFLQQFKSPYFTAVCARIFRGYGKNSRDVISRWIRSLLADEAITVYRPEGWFDYIYAGDSAEGLVRLAIDNSITGIINLGTGRSRRVSDIVNILRVYFPKMEVILESSNLPFEASQADMNAYYAATGWKPEFDLERTIPEIIAYEKDRQIQVQGSAKTYGFVLVTSASKKVSLLEALRKAARKLNPEIKIVAGDTDPTAVSRYIADYFWQMPATKESEIDAIIKGCKERHINIIIPSRDGELRFWAKYQSRFADEGIKVIVSPLNSIEICLDKLGFAEFGVEHNLPFILTSQSLDAIDSKSYVVKERYGAGSKTIGINLSKEDATQQGSLLKHPIYQPFVSGQEISVDAWLSYERKVKGLVLRSRDYVVGGEAQVTTTFRDPKIESEMINILEQLKLRGSVILQAIIDQHNKIHIIECNPRFGGASTASIAVGLDSFYWTLLECYHADLSDYPFQRKFHEVRQVRVPSDIHVYL